MASHFSGQAPPALANLAQPAPTDNKADKEKDRAGRRRVGRVAHYDSRSVPNNEPLGVRKDGATDASLELKNTAPPADNENNSGNSLSSEEEIVIKAIDAPIPPEYETSKDSGFILAQLESKSDESETTSSSHLSPEAPLSSDGRRDEPGQQAASQSQPDTPEHVRQLSPDEMLAIGKRAGRERRLTVYGLVQTVQSLHHLMPKKTTRSSETEFGGRSGCAVVPSRLVRGKILTFKKFWRTQNDVVRLSLVFVFGHLRLYSFHHPYFV